MRGFLMFILYGFLIAIFYIFYETWRYEEWKFLRIFNSVCYDIVVCWEFSYDFVEIFNGVLGLKIQEIGYGPYIKNGGDDFMELSALVVCMCWFPREFHSETDAVRILFEGYERGFCSIEGLMFFEGRFESCGFIGLKFESDFSFWLESGNPGICFFEDISKYCIDAFSLDVFGCFDNAEVLFVSISYNLYCPLWRFIRRFGGFRGIGETNVVCGHMDIVMKIRIWKFPYKE